MKKLSTYIMVVLVTFFSMISCEKWLDVNTSPDNPTSVTPDQILPVLVFYTSQLEYDHAEYGVYLSQCLTTGGRSQTGSYAYKQGWEFLSMNRHPQWRRHYYDLGVNIFVLTEEAKKNNYRNYALIARTMRLHSTLMTTDLFGGIPLRESYGHIEDLEEYWYADFYEDKSKLQPVYESQEDVYAWLEREVDKLLDLYEDTTWTKCPTNQPINEKMDRIYQGDLGKWAAFTKALKARMLIRKLPNWDNNAKACQEIIDAVDAVLNDPNWQEPLYHYYADGSGEKNAPWGPMQPVINSWESRANLLSSAIPSRFFGHYLLGMYNFSPANVKTISPKIGLSLDPRASRMMSPRGGANNANQEMPLAFRYLDNNKGMDISLKATNYPDLYGIATEGLSILPQNPYTKDDGYVAIYTKEELLFIKAEAEYWLSINQGRTGQDAYETTLLAVDASMERYGVMAADSTSTANLEAKTHAWFRKIRLAKEDFSIATIMQQKYVAMYLLSEQWTDVRRYNHSSSTNGITYNGIFVYDVNKVHVEENIYKLNNPNKFTKAPESFFTETKSLTRPYNLYEAYWTTAINFGVNAKFSPNAWVHRLNYDPETEDKYNVEQLQSLGAYKNPDWLRKRMVWARKNNDYVMSADAIEWE
ncbi:MAG: SusD/RagB family nutrient-binding outer membrane lipoprotein [Paludibacteraceae bacterium]|nr:SusD/RagB family nutrient-binding outer membrane lipoprotein [Paludibacteraceae bacterium]